MSITLPVAATCRLRGHVFTSDEPQLDDEGVSIGVVTIELDRCRRCGDLKRVRTSGYVPRHARIREDLTATDVAAETDDTVESTDNVDRIESLDPAKSAAPDEAVDHDVAAVAEDDIDHSVVNDEIDVLVVARDDIDDLVVAHDDINDLVVRETVNAN